MDETVLGIHYCERCRTDRCGVRRLVEDGTATGDRAGRTTGRAAE